MNITNGRIREILAARLRRSPLVTTRTMLNETLMITCIACMLAAFAHFSFIHHHLVYAPATKDCKVYLCHEAAWMKKFPDDMELLGPALAILGIQVSLVLAVMLGPARRRAQKVADIEFLERAKVASNGARLVGLMISTGLFFYAVLVFSIDTAYGTLTALVILFLGVLSAFLVSLTPTLGRIEEDERAAREREGKWRQERDLAAGALSSSRGIGFSSNRVFRRLPYLTIGWSGLVLAYLGSLLIALPMGFVWSGSTPGDRYVCLVFLMCLLSSAVVMVCVKFTADMVLPINDGGIGDRLISTCPLLVINFFFIFTFVVVARVSSPPISLLAGIPMVMSLVGVLGTIICLHLNVHPFSEIRLIRAQVGLYRARKYLNYLSRYES